MAGTVTPIYNTAQLMASSTAATRNGVPVNIVRGVAGFTYGNSATAANFESVAAALERSFKTFFGQSGNALVAWGKAAAQQMPGASATQVATATSNQAVAKTGILTAPAIGLAAAATAPADAAAVDAATGADTAGAAAGDTAAADTAAGAGAGSAITSALTTAAKSFTTAQVLGEIWQDMKHSAKYAAVTAGAILLGAILIWHAFSGSGGGGSKIRVVPVP